MIFINGKFVGGYNDMRKEVSNKNINLDDLVWNKLIIQIMNINNILIID